MPYQNISGLTHGLNQKSEPGQSPYLQHRVLF